ncbi:MAG: TolC family protein [Candidatus Omnitrophota bacterium]|nr:MAG: TolC family protein [Candidatus Omnitrophota bacterium]
MHRIILMLFIIIGTSFSSFSQELSIGDIQEKDVVSQSPSQESFLELSLQEVSQLALKNSLDIQIVKFDAYIKRYDLDKAQSIFDTFLNLEANYTDDQKKPASIILGTKTLQNKYKVSLEKKLPTGTLLKLEGSQERDWSNSAFVSVNPATDAKATISLSQSIGKNFFGLADRLGIKITKLDIENSDWTSLDDISEALAAAQRAYWNLALKEEELKIKRALLGEARALHDIFKEKFDVGLAEEPDVFASAANLKLRENEVLVAELERNTAKNDLLFLLNENNTDIQIKSRDTLDVSPSRISLGSALTEAIDNRRDYKRAKNYVLANKLDIILKKNSLWPEIDLEASFARNGLSTKYKKSWDGVFSEDNPELFLGIRVRIPFENRNAKADYNKAKLEKEKYFFNLKKTERLILRQLNNQVASVNTLAEEIKAYSEIVMLQEKKLEAEKKKLQYGRSSSDIVIRYEDDLLNARLSLAKTLFQYRVNLIELELAKNTLLDTYWKDKL